jgi:hypothetical protein
MKPSDVKSKAALLNDIDKQMKWIRIFTWIYSLIRLRKRIKIITGPDMVIWYIPQVKLNIFSSWKNLNVIKEEKLPTLHEQVEDNVDLCKAIVKIGTNKFTAFDKMQEAEQCLARFEILLAQQKFIESAKPKYVYL